ncbi:adenosylhomocysteinase [Natrinema salaciae]|uniref:Adenosylhomocysteinase n=1 Tax=Natrinema salaciae TaxID=1186196 RepID=A0A1H9IE78_9EURY|nr:adenosylhomocysteinase [Natrinema salaciae]SEQ72792.1 adenosylhomocysteinase [Natrinema salaciae]
MTDTEYPSISEQLDDVASAREEGRRKMDWAAQHMPICEHVREEFVAEQPFEGERIGMAMHVEAKTAILVETLAEGGAEVAVTGCNPLSTHDDVSAALEAHENITSYAKRGVDDEEYYAAIEAVIAHEPTITVDDGMDLVAAIHEDHPELIDGIIGGAEETTTGVHRLRAMDADGALEYPVFAVNDTPMKRLFDNVHGTGESSLASIAMTTNLSWAGKNVVVAGYGYCGKGVAKKAAGQNANVIVTEVEPRRALEAHMEGYEVMPMAEAAAVGDVFLTTTGNRDVVVEEHFEKMQDGVLLANAGHFDIEIDLDALDDLAVDRYEARDGVEAYEMDDGRRLNVVAEGRLVNLAAPVSLGHPVEVMDQSFGVQAVCVRELVESVEPRAADASGDEPRASDVYDAGVHDVPDELDKEIAEIKLEAEGVDFDSLTETQHEYMDSWDHGT